MTDPTPNLSPTVPGQDLTTFTLTPSNLKEAMEFSKIIAESDLVPKDYKGKPGNVLVAVQMGLELGLKPLQAIQGIAVINGRPSVWGDALLALVRASPHFEAIEEEQTETEAVCRVKRRGEAAITRSFSMADATKAGLANKEGPWRQYTRRMLQMRARAFALRDGFADVLKGISMAEEARDMQDHSLDIEGTVGDRLNERVRALADSGDQDANASGEEVTADTSPAAMRKMLEAFAVFGVTREQIEKRIQRRLDSITSAQVVSLKKIYATLRDATSTPRDWFEVPQAAAEELNERLRAKAAKVKPSAASGESIDSPNPPPPADGPSTPPGDASS